MCQAEVFDFLKKEKKWVFVIDIQKKLKTNRGSVTRNLKKLFEQGDVLYKEVLAHNSRKERIWRIK